MVGVSKLEDGGTGKTYRIYARLPSDEHAPSGLPYRGTPLRADISRLHVLWDQSIAVGGRMGECKCAVSADSLQGLDASYGRNVYLAQSALSARTADSPETAVKWSPHHTGGEITKAEKAVASSRLLVRT